MAITITDEMRRVLDTDFSREPTVRGPGSLLPLSVRTEGEWDAFVKAALALKLPGTTSPPSILSKLHLPRFLRHRKSLPVV